MKREYISPRSVAIKMDNQVIIAASGDVPVDGGKTIDDRNGVLVREENTWLHFGSLWDDEW